jgi:hypothetical protein
MILRRPQERAVLKELGMGAFFLSDSISGFCTIVRATIRNWPEIKRLAATRRRPFLYLVKHASVTPIRKKSLGDDRRAFTPEDENAGPAASPAEHRTGGRGHGEPGAAVPGRDRGRQMA